MERGQNDAMVKRDRTRTNPLAALIFAVYPSHPACRGRTLLTWPCERVVMPDVDGERGKWQDELLKQTPRSGMMNLAIDGDRGEALLLFSVLSALVSQRLGHSSSHIACTNVRLQATPHRPIFDRIHTLIEIIPAQVSHNGCESPLLLFPFSCPCS